MRTARQIFKDKGNNFTTPETITFRNIGNLGVELSTGVDFDGNRIFGVTVLNLTTERMEHEMSRLFRSLEDAKDYIIELGGK